MKVKEIKNFDVQELRRIIDIQDFFDGLDCEEKEQHIANIIDYACGHEPTTENIYYMAKDIYDNTLKDYYDSSEITDLMKYTFETAVCVNFEITEKE